MTSETLQREAIRIINEAGAEAQINVPNGELEESTEKFYAKLTSDSVFNLQGQKILTSTESGV